MLAMASTVMAVMLGCAVGGSEISTTNASVIVCTPNAVCWILCDTQFDPVVVAMSPLPVFLDVFDPFVVDFGI
jgi:hypothetical protein